MVQIRSSWLTPSAASSSRGLSWPRGLGLCLYLGRGLSSTWKCSYKCTPALSTTCSSREQLLCTRLFCYYSPDFLFAPVHSPEKNGEREQRITYYWRKRFSLNANVECPGKLLTNCSGIEIANQLDNCVTWAIVSSAAHCKCSFTTLLNRYWITCGIFLPLFAHSRPG